MEAMTLSEAQLYRVLTALFGRDQVVPQMSVMAVCGGTLPQSCDCDDVELDVWAKKNKCLFTIVDSDDNPKLVVEFFSGFEQAIDVKEEEHQRVLEPLLGAAGIRYVTISPSEFAEILDPGSSLDMVAFLRSKVDPTVANENPWPEEIS